MPLAPRRTIFPSTAAILREKGVLVTLQDANRVFTGLVISVLTATRWHDARSFCGTGRISDAYGIHQSEYFAGALVVVSVALPHTAHRCDPSGNSVSRANHQ